MQRLPGPVEIIIICLGVSSLPLLRSAGHSSPSPVYLSHSAVSFNSIRPPSCEQAHVWASEAGKAKAALMNECTGDAAAGRSSSCRST